jgi:hypothetical protein
VSFPLLITATVKPPMGAPFLTRTDTRVRMDDYAQAFRLYIGIDDDAVDRIVFVDNSNSDLSLLERIAAEAGVSKDIELVSYQGQDYGEQGRSVAETHLIDHALGASRILSALGANELFWKVSGRLRVTNLAQMLESTPSDCGLYIDFRRHRHHWVDTRIFAATPGAFRRLFRSRIDVLRQDLLPPGVVAPEQRLFDSLLPERERERIVPRLRREPVIEGYSGLGENYRRPRRRIESSVRSVTRRLLPSLWICL